MSKKLYEESNIEAIAEAIRSKKDTDDTYKVSEMASAISSIPVGDGRCPRGIGKGVNNVFLNEELEFDPYAQSYEMPFSGEAYIESHGTEYVDTGYIPKENTKVIMRCNMNPTNKSYACPFGGRATNSPTGAFAAYRQNNSTTTYTVQYGSKTYNGTGLILGADVEIILCKEFLSTVFGKFKSTQYNLSSQSGSPSANLYLFALCQGTAPEGTNTYCIMKFYECFIYEGESLEHHYIPAVGVNDEACLYDAVTETYLYNLGTGSFTYVEAQE